MSDSNLINVFQPKLGNDELEAVKRVFNKNWPGKGEEVNGLETEFASFLGVPRENIMTVNSCTEAVFQILEVLGLSEGEVIVPTNSFVGVGNAVLSAGLQIKLCDVDALSGNATLDTITAVTSEKTKVVILQHFGGIPADIESIAGWCTTKGIVIIEDAAGALGSTFNSKIVGTFGDFGVWSLDAMKMVVAGDGGVIFSKDAKIANDLRERSYLGLTNVSGLIGSPKTDERWWEFDVSQPGRRSIMNDISGAIGRVQLSKLPQNIETRRKNAFQYMDRLSRVPQLTLSMGPWLETSCHYFFPVQLNERDGLARSLREQGIYTTFRYFPLNRVPIYGSTASSFPGSDKFSNKTLLLPQHNSLTKEEIDKVCDAIENFFESN